MRALKTIGTHDGTFHCDEVLGCSMLRILYPDAQIIRSRKDDVLAKCDIVIDVGGKYEAHKYRFDHHQNTFNHSMSTLMPGKKWTIKLSSAGLVYYHFGQAILKAIAESLNDEDLDAVYDKVYEGFVQEIDAIDNGIPICDGEQKYWISTNISARVSRLNKRWTVPDSEFDETAAFNDAMAMVTKEFIDRVLGYVNEWLPAKRIVKSSISQRLDVHPSGEIILLQQHCPWKAHMFVLEEGMKVEPKLKFVLFQDKTTWRVQAVSMNECSFELRAPLHEDWRGLRDDELTKKSGIDGCLFVHSNGFIGGNQTKEGALQMAIKSIEHSKQ